MAIRSVSSPAPTPDFDGAPPKDAQCEVSQFFMTYIFRAARYEKAGLGAPVERTLQERLPEWESVGPGEPRERPLLAIVIQPSFAVAAQDVIGHLLRGPDLVFFRDDKPAASPCRSAAGKGPRACSGFSPVLFLRGKACTFRRAWAPVNLAEVATSLAFRPVDYSRCLL